MESLAEKIIEIRDGDEEEIYYPESDGEPMAETDVHRNLMVYFIEALKDYYRDEPEIYVSGNLFIYYKEGDPRAVVSPDFFVVKGVAQKDRRTYKLWEEGKFPDLVIEFTSKKTKLQDLTTKKQIYQDMLKVKEYFLYDPLGDYLKPPFQGFRAVRGTYKPVDIKEERLYSTVLGLELGVDDSILRAYNPLTGEKLLTPLESAQARRIAEVRAQKSEKDARHEKAKREQAEKDAIHEKAKREQAEKDAIHEKAKRAQAERELQKLKEKLEALRQK